MPTRRRYGPRKYRDGGAVDIVVEAPPEMPEPVASVEVSPQPAPPKPRDYPDLPPSDHHDLDAVKRAAEAVRRAEELQQELRNPQRLIDEYVNSMPGLSDHKKNFLKQNPLLLNEHVMPIAGRAWQQGLAQGIADDSEQMNRHILSSVRLGIEAHRHQATPAPSPQSIPAMSGYDSEEAERLNAEAAELGAKLPPPMPVPASAYLAPIEKAKRSLPVSAPVSRDVPTSGGQKTSAQQTITLNAEQRSIAHASYHWLSKPAAEAEYARQALKLSDLRKRGLYPESDRN